MLKMLDALGNTREKLNSKSVGVFEISPNNWSSFVNTPTGPCGGPKHNRTMDPTREFFVEPGPHRRIL